MFEQVGRLVSALMLELYPEHQETYTESSLAAFVIKLLSSDKRVWAWLARVDEKIVGFITLMNALQFMRVAYLGRFQSFTYCLNFAA